MGVKNLPWKKLVVGVAIVLGIISSVITIAGVWRQVTEPLISFFSRIWGAIISPTGRDVALFILIGIVLFVIFKRRKNTAKKPESIEVKAEAIFILEMVGATSSEKQFKEEVFRLYREKYGFIFKDMDAVTLGFNAIINWLKRKEYISDDVEQDEDGFGEFISIKDKGFKYIEVVRKKLAEEEGRRK